MSESIFKASIRYFFIALCGIIGFILGIFIILAILGSGYSASSLDSTPQITYKYTPEIKPNAIGIRKVESSKAPVILKVNINGIIGLDSLTRSAISELLIESRERALDDDRVKAILLCINSPGGTVTDADGIYRELLAYKEQYKVPVYAYVDGLCASGGYYIASAADKIFASDVSLIGSVGVIIPSIMNFSQLMEKIGVQSISLYDGKGKDNLNPFRPWHKGEEDNLQNSVNYYYQMFVNVVTAKRLSLDKTKLIEEYGANVFPAEIAKQHGYIDEYNASLNQTLKLLVENIGIKDNFYQVVELENKNWLSEIFRSQFNLFSGKISHQISLSSELPSELSGQYLYLYRP
jgi:protease-4